MCLSVCLSRLSRLPVNIMWVRYTALVSVSHFCYVMSYVSLIVIKLLVRIIICIFDLYLIIVVLILVRYYTLKRQLK